MKVSLDLEPDELAKPIFSKGIFVGFEIMEINDKTLQRISTIQAKLVKNEQLAYDAHGCFRYVYACELYNMEMYSTYDKFDRKREYH